MRIRAPLDSQDRLKQEEALLLWCGKQILGPSFKARSGFESLSFGISRAGGARPERWQPWELLTIHDRVSVLNSQRS